MLGDLVPRFCAKIQDQTRGLFYLCLLALGLIDVSEVEINNVLGEGDNITFIIRIQKESASSFMVPIYFLDEF